MGADAPDNVALRKSDVAMALSGGASKLLHDSQPEVNTVLQWMSPSAHLKPTLIEEKFASQNLALGLLPLPVILLQREELRAILYSIHEAGVLHGDVRANNIMRDHSGRLRFTDFDRGSLRAMSSDYVAEKERLALMENTSNERLSLARMISHIRHLPKCNAYLFFCGKYPAVGSSSSSGLITREANLLSQGRGKYLSASENHRCTTTRRELHDHFGAFESFSDLQQYIMRWT